MYKECHLNVSVCAVSVFRMYCSHWTQHSSRIESFQPSQQRTPAAPAAGPNPASELMSGLGEPFKTQPHRRCSCCCCCCRCSSSSNMPPPAAALSPALLLLPPAPIATTPSLPPRLAPFDCEYPAPLLAGVCVCARARARACPFAPSCACVRARSCPHRAVPSMRQGRCGQASNPRHNAAKVSDAYYHGRFHVSSCRVPPRPRSGPAKAAELRAAVCRAVARATCRGRCACSARFGARDTRPRARGAARLSSSVFRTPAARGTRRESRTASSETHPTAPPVLLNQPAAPRPD